MEYEKLVAELRQTQQRLRHIIVSSPAVLFTLGVRGERIEGISWISENLQYFLGYSPEAALGQDWFSSNIHPDDRDRVLADTKTLFSRGQVAHEYRLRHGDGNYRWTRCELRLIQDQTGESVEAVGALLDITERKRSEVEQSNLREQLQQAQKLESIGRLAAGIAHDFNNLLTIINVYCDILLEELQPGHPAYESLSEVRMAGERATALSKQLLMLNRKQVTHFNELNLNEIIAEVERMLARVLGDDIRLKSVLSPSLGYVLADPGQLHQVLMNLAVNARDAMPNGGTLLIETENVELGPTYVDQHHGVKPGGYVQLRVSDTGTGMTKEVMSHLFEPFFTTKEPGEGTGLGLATVYGIVKQAGGAIWVYSELGQGTTFTIYLPRIEKWATAPPEAVVSPALGGAETILVVEDNEQLRNLLTILLRRYGYYVLAAADPEEALAQFERSPGTIPVVLTDVVMPGSSGPDLADRIKAIRPETKVVFMSGYSEPWMVDRGVLDSSAEYLQKPFSPEALASKVREVLGAPAAKGTILIADDEGAIRHSARKLLTGLGYTVLEARDGREAVKELERSHINLLIVDLAMPEQEGLETIQAVRREYPEVKIVAISGCYPEMLRTAEHLGADASLAKPIRPDELIEIIGRLMGGIGD